MAAILTQKNRFLLTRRPDNKNHGGLWEFPGGKINTGETKQQALVRELEEELQVRIKKEELNFLGTIHSQDFSIHFFSADLNQSYSPQEHPATCWTNLDEVGNKDLCPSDQKALQEFQTQIGQVVNQL